MEKEKYLRIEIDEMLNIFDYYQIVEERQKRIILEGITFKFWDDVEQKNFNIVFDCFKFAQLLKTYKLFDLELDVYKLLGDIPGYPQYPYRDMVLSFCELAEKSKKRVRS